MRPDALCGLLAEPDRLAAFAAVVLGARTPGEVADRTGLSGRDVLAALRRLEQGGLVTVAGDGLTAHVTAFKDAIREYGPAAPEQEPSDTDPGRALGGVAGSRTDAVLRAFLRDGRIVQLPAARAKRRVLLEHVAAAFEPGVRYPEREVDTILRAWHDDHATLRRYLIDEGLMSRDAGVYWRTGGYVDI